MNIEELLACIEPFSQEIGIATSDVNSLPETLLHTQISSVTNDSSSADGKSIFVAITGSNTDSHKYISDARQQGASFVIGEYSEGENAVDLVVQRSRAVLGPLSAALNGFPSLDLNLVGVTGTNGKTTISYLYSSIVQAHKKHCFTMGTTGILLDSEKESDSQTTPDPLILQSTFVDFLNRDIASGVLEVSSHALDQYRVLGTEFKAVGFTNMSQDHLDYHESMEEYLQAKLKLFSRTYSTKAVINIDGTESEKFAAKAREENLEILLVSCKDSSADLYVEAQSMDIQGSILRIVYKDKNNVFETTVNSPMIGEFNHENIAVALGLALQTGFDFETSCKALENPNIVPGRLQKAISDKEYEIFVDYAHTPDALQRALETLKPMSSRLIAVFGAGGDRDKTKRPLMGRAADLIADEIIVTSDNPRSEDPMAIIKDIGEGITKDFHIEPDRKKAIALAMELAGAKDVIVVAGKGHERGQTFADRVEDFYDMDAIEDLLKENI